MRTCDKETRRTKNARSVMAVALSLSLCVTGLAAGGETVSLAKKKAEPRLQSSKLKINLCKKATKTMRLKNIKKKHVQRLIVKSSDKKIAEPKVSGASKVSFGVKGKNIGQATFTVTLKTKKAINNKKEFTMELAVTVIDSSKGPEETDKPTTEPPSTTDPVATVTPTPAEEPTAAPTASAGSTLSPVVTLSPTGGGPTGNRSGSGSSGGSGRRTPSPKPTPTATPTAAPTVTPTATPDAGGEEADPVEPTVVIPQTKDNDAVYDPYMEYAGAFMAHQMENALDEKPAKVEVYDALTAGEGDTPLPSKADSASSVTGGFQTYANVGENECPNWRPDKTVKSILCFRLPIEKCFKPEWMAKINEIKANYDSDPQAQGHLTLLGYIAALRPYVNYLLEYAVSNFEDLGIMSVRGDELFWYEPISNTLYLNAWSCVKKDDLKDVTAKYKSVISKLESQAQAVQINTDLDKAIFAHEQTALFGEAVDKKDVKNNEDTNYNTACHSPMSLVFNGRGSMMAYASLFNVIGRRLGLVTHLVANGNDLLNESEPISIWNAVCRTGGNWYTVDAFLDDFLPGREIVSLGASQGDSVFNRDTRDTLVHVFLMAGPDQITEASVDYNDISDKVWLGNRKADNLHLEVFDDAHKHDNGFIGKNNHPIYLFCDASTASEMAYLKREEEQMRSGVFCFPMYRTPNAHLRYQLAQDTSHLNIYNMAFDSVYNYSWTTTMLIDTNNENLVPIEKGGHNASAAVIPETGYFAFKSTASSVKIPSTLGIAQGSADHAPAADEPYRFSSYYDAENSKTIMYESCELNTLPALIRADITDYTIKDEVGYIDPSLIDSDRDELWRTPMSSARICYGYGGSHAFEGYADILGTNFISGMISGLYSNAWGTFYCLKDEYRKNPNGADEGENYHYADAWHALAHTGDQRDDYLEVFEADGKPKEKYDLGKKLPV